MVTDGYGFCKHRNGKQLRQCIKYDKVQRGIMDDVSCERYCTAFDTCLGYDYGTSGGPGDAGWCALYTSSKSCPTDNDDEEDNDFNFDWLIARDNTSYGSFATTPNDLVEWECRGDPVCLYAKRVDDYPCYAKLSKV